MSTQQEYNSESEPVIFYENLKDTQKEAENGNKEAQFNLGVYYEKGIGIEKNEVKAFDWYQKAAENGVKEAQFNLGVYYEKGIGTEKDEVKAFFWCQKVAENGDKEAQHKLG